VPSYAQVKGLSVEEAARRARYAFMGSLAQRLGAAVAVAHNADDQVETVLMAILRGTGLTGLSGMQPLDTVALTSDPELVSAFPHERDRPVELFRPLLGAWRYEIEEYCSLHGLEPRQDSTNVDHSYRRNRVRHDLIPYLQHNYSPAIKDHIYRLADIARSDDALGEAIAQDMWARLASIDASRKLVQFKTAEFSAELQALQRRLVRMSLQSVAGALADFTFAHIEDAASVMAGDEGAPPALDLPHGVRVERTAGNSIVRMRDDTVGVDLAQSCDRPLAGEAPTPIRAGEHVELDHGWALIIEVVDGTVERPTDDWHAVFDYDGLIQHGSPVLRRRMQGDHIRPFGMKGRRSLQDLMVDAKIPRGCRASLAVLALSDSGEVIWVPGPGGRRSGHAPLTGDTRRVLEMRFVKRE
jgi:tRNA(Ile)-lysidine synthase